MISFENTEIAFQSKSDKDLNKAYWLFKIVASKSMVKLGKVGVKVAFATRLPINGMIRKTIFSQFCGGESIQDCKSTIDQLDQFKIGTILDYSVEGKTSAEDFEATTNEIIKTIMEAKGNDSIPFAVFKVTGISRFSILEKSNSGIDQLTKDELDEYLKFVERIDKICKSAHDADVPVFIDAEETWIQDTIDRIAFEMMLKYNQEKPIVYNTIQMYRSDRLAFLENVLAKSRAEKIQYGIKLVRGAYMEKERERASAKGYPSPIQPDKASSDNDFNKALELITDHLDICALCSGSHNENSANHLAALMKLKGINKQNKRIYFAQLLGMSDHISYNLSHHEYNVAKYVPYGPIKEVMPYLLRRADENTSVAGQTSRELSLIMKELTRRKSKKTS
jgi:proline dehydrogenase